MGEVIGITLKALREYYGWSQRELAKRAGVPNSAISVIEHGSVSPSILSLEKVLRGFPLTIQQFFAVDASLSPSEPTLLASRPAPALMPDARCALIQVSYHQAAQGEGSEHQIPSTASLLIITTGSARYSTLNGQQILKAGQQIELTAHIPYQVEADSAEAHWLVIASNR
ncbi:MAG: hypothetical protein CL693_01780 [Cellvibrionaceae bacterium]|nr:hypothetical protein [Cellvibrionaceae bacterium]|tara:strand:- start:15844 stop:16353 length:510 start_codon:yes stop_codon:yes gene_type:complete